MSRLADPTICPDCRAVLDTGARCTGCGLHLEGPLAAQLWTAMTAADRVVEQLRATTTVRPREAAGHPVPVPAAGPATSLPQYPLPAPREPAPRPRRLPSASVPVVLLTLGALCVLVAAVVFIAVTWSLLGLTGRTVVLLGFTALLAGIAVLLTRKGLRGASETFWLVVAGMLTVDLLAAQSAGLAGLDALGWRGTSALVGGALLALGVGVGAWSRSQPVLRAYGAEVVAAAGILLLCLGNGWLAANPAIGTAVAVPLLAGLALVLRRVVPLSAYAAAGLALLSWCYLLTLGWERALETSTVGAWWSDFRGWPLAVAAVLAAVLVHAPGLPVQLRPVAAGAALLPLAILVNAPSTVASPTRDLLGWSATLLALALISAFAPRIWALGAAAWTTVGVLGMGLFLAVNPWSSVGYLDFDGATPVGSTLPAFEDNAATWAFGVAAVVVVAAMAALLRRVPPVRHALALGVFGALAPAVLALGIVVVVCELEPPLWGGVLAAALATAVAGGAAWVVRGQTVPAVVGSLATGYFAVLTLWTASAAHLLSACSATALALGLLTAFALREREGSDLAAGIAGAMGALVGGYALVSWGLVLEAGQESEGLALAVYAALVGMVASPLTRRTPSRVALEVAAGMLAVFAVALSVDAQGAAMALTVVGTGIAVIAVTNRDRLVLGWLGAVVLGFATVIRVVEEVRFPELYTLPAAALLVAAGIWRLSRDPGTSSFVALGSGLTLALLPSLLLALDEPVSLRGALVGFAALVSLAWGVQQRLAAPFALGALATAVLALRHLQPIADAVPRWVSLGLVGLALLVVGITWEARRRNVETAGRYLTALR
jgi:hypothetical protein